MVLLCVSSGGQLAAGDHLRLRRHAESFFDGSTIGRSGLRFVWGYMSQPRPWGGSKATARRVTGWRSRWTGSQWRSGDVDLAGSRPERARELRRRLGAKKRNLLSVFLTADSVRDVADGEHVRKHDLDDPRKLHEVRLRNVEGHFHRVGVGARELG